MPDNLDDWLILIESFHPEEIELGLDRISQVAEKLGCKNLEFPVITVAGTNGKGSCVEAIKQLAISHGKNVGSYSSPHLFRFNERIQIDGREVEDSALIEAFELIQECRKLFKPEIQLSFFEFTTLAALLFFKSQKPDLVVLEVGLGGRLDAVNIVEPDIAVLTSIGVDHEAWLGDTRDKIAREKLGIARPDKYLVVGERNLSNLMMGMIKETGAQSLLVDRDFHLVDKGPSYDFSTSNESIVIDKQGLTLYAENLLTALQAFSCLVAPVNPEDVRSAFSNARLPGRFQIFESNGKKVVVDLTHNPAGAEFLKRQLLSSGVVGNEQLLAVMCGIMKDKDFEGIVDILRPLSEEWILPRLKVDRAEVPEVLEGKLLKKAISHCSICDSVENGLEQFLAQEKSEDILLVMGSFYTVAPALAYLENIGATAAWK